MKILFIDDDRNILGMMEEIITAPVGVKMVFSECHSVADALGAVDREKPDIIFLDNSLSKGHDEGIDVVKALAGKSMKIFTTTSDPNIEEVYRLMGIPRVEKSDADSIERIMNKAAYAAASDG